jgi:shikimate kinase
MLEERVTAATHRPLARDAKLFADLYEQRREHYGRAAYRVEIVSDDADATVEAILGLPLFVR